MANWQDPQTTGVNAATVGVPTVARDAGLRSYMLSVYNYMASGVLLTGIVALLFSRGGGIAAAQVFAKGGRSPWLIILSPLAIVFAMSFGANRMSDRHAAGAVLGLRDPDGPVAVDDLPASTPAPRSRDVLRDRGGLRGAEPVRLHHQEGSVGLRHAS